MKILGGLICILLTLFILAGIHYSDARHHKQITETSRENSVLRVSRHIKSDADSTSVQTTFASGSQIRALKAEAVKLFSKPNLTEAFASLFDVKHWDECVETLKSTRFSFISRVYLNFIEDRSVIHKEHISRISMGTPLAMQVYALLWLDLEMTVVGAHAVLQTVNEPGVFELFTLEEFKGLKQFAQKFDEEVDTLRDHYTAPGPEVEQYRDVLRAIIKSGDEGRRAFIFTTKNVLAALKASQVFRINVLYARCPLEFRSTTRIHRMPMKRGETLSEISSELWARMLINRLACPEQKQGFPRHIDCMGDILERSVGMTFYETLNRIVDADDCKATMRN